jgi:DNA-binding winged helix-turn-helix (wHTH) protein/TolB-like protein/Tfp pilus assembly protein PilF
MYKGHNHLREFSGFRLDAENKFLWHEDQPVDLPLKAIELLCVLADKDGEVVSKQEIWRNVWQDAFVEETNLTHNIYLLRKAFKKFGEDSLIQTVPRRGYRFNAGRIENHNVVLQKHTRTRTLIEIGDAPSVEKAVSGRTNRRADASPYFRVGAIALCIVLLSVFSFLGYQTLRSAASAPEIRSIAVLPFTTIDSKTGVENEGLGLADALVTRLSNIKAVTVRPTAAVLGLQGHDPLAAGRQLKVDGVLEGTIYRRGETVRVTARLVRLSDGSAIWTGQFEKAAKDELRLQNEISLQVAETLASSLDAGQRKALVKTYTESGDAWHIYQKARFEWSKRTWAGMTEAQRLFRNAIAIDPNFALAYSGLADTLATDKAAAAEARSVANRAIELDPTLPEAHASLGFIQMFHSWNWEAAESSLKRSVELNKNYATAHHWLSQVYAIRGRYAEAKTAMSRALEINPISPNFLADMGQIHYFAKEYVAAEDYCKKALEIDPDFVFAHEYLHDIYLITGEYAKAVDAELEAQRINLSLPTDSDQRKKELGDSRQKQRELFRDGGIARFEEYHSTRASQLKFDYIASTRQMFLGNKENAIKGLAKSLEDRSFLIVFAKADPIFDSIRNDPRFQAILAKMEL